MGQKITIEPVTRVEGHGKVTIHLDDENNVVQTRLHIVEFRGFERFIQGRPYWEAPVLVQRLCGICPVSHHLAAAKALDVIVGVGPRRITPDGRENEKTNALWSIFSITCLAFFSPGLAGSFIRDRCRSGEKKHNRSSEGIQGSCRSGCDDAKIRTGDHSGNGW